jgi:hypothetical protein
MYCDMPDESAILIEQMIEKHCEKFALLPVEVRAQMEDDLLKRVDDEVFGALVRALPFLKRLRYRKIVRTGTEQKRREYLLKNTPNKDAIIATELAIFRRLYA